MRKWMNRIVLSGCLLLIGTQSIFAQCAMCRGAMESSVSAGDTSMAANLNTGIMYLFLAPYVLLGSLAFFWYRTSKRNARKIQASGHIAG